MVQIIVLNWIRILHQYDEVLWFDMYLLDITLIVTNDYQLINMIFSGLIDYAIKLCFFNQNCRPLIQVILQLSKYCKTHICANNFYMGIFLKMQESTIDSIYSVQLARFKFKLLFQL